MPLYKHKPTQCEAFRFGYDSTPQWFKDAAQQGIVMPAAQDGIREYPNRLIVAECAQNTLGCQITFRIGDYIVRKDDGHLYVYTESRFAKLYTLVNL